MHLIKYRRQAQNPIYKTVTASFLADNILVTMYIFRLGLGLNQWYLILIPYKDTTALQPNAMKVLW